MITIYHRTVKDKSLKQIKRYKPGSWVYVVKPSRDELKKISEDINLELKILKDATDPFEVPRLEIKDENIYIFTRVPHRKNNEITSIPLLIILTPKFLITISKAKFKFLEELLKDGINLSTTQKTKLLLQVFSLIYTQYHTFLTQINKELKSNRINIEKINNKDIVKLIQYEETLNEFTADLVPTGATLNNLLGSYHINLFEEDKQLVEDLMLANNEIINLSRAKLKSLVTLRNAYSTIMTNNLNRVIRVLTGLTVILMVPTIITGLYGMNVALPFATTPEAFWIIMIFMSSISIFLLFLFIKNRWF